MNRAFVLVLALLLSSVSPGHAVKLRYNVKPGETWKSTATMMATGKFEVMGINRDLELEAKATTTRRITAGSADSGLEATIEHRSEAIKLKVAGLNIPELPLPPVNPISVAYSALGKVLKIEGIVPQSAAGGPDLGKVLSAFLLPLPEREVQVGDTWQLAAEDSLLPAAIRCKLLETGKEGGRDIARVEMKLSMTGDALTRVNRDILKSPDGIELGGSFDSVTVFVIDLATGLPRRASGTVEADLIMKIGGVDIRQTFTGTVEEGIKQ